jgi:hypothetical protein
MVPGNGGPHAIFLPRQKRQASAGFFSNVFMPVVSKELRPIDGDCTECKRNSVVGGVNGEEGMCDVSNGGESR